MLAVHVAPFANLLEVPAEGSLNVPIAVLSPGIVIALPVRGSLMRNPGDDAPKPPAAGVAGGGVGVVSAGLCAHLHTQFPLGQSLWDVHAAPALFCPAPVFVIV